ncbi:glutathione peroxidase [Vagococcus penaei]|uniref:Glutathione peroxidase n=1 Tax=Vagococcus penaei TaxID=633807 RepID=A0A1Q2D8H9_9ENTE|nr:glutathione peroxidase [Vagococcus penaei]AQP54650.1 glutathione peroxidase [Vagococcus penaei]RSU05302.1 glutathione peroxidase [Vagococcus penaei]
MTIYEYNVDKMNGTTQALRDYQGKVVLIVNTASKCGFAKQFSGLEELYKKYKEQNFIVLGFPCNQFLNQEPNSNEEIAEICQLNYGVTFPMFAKINVRGQEQSPLFGYLIDETGGKKIKWNFTKFLINRDGTVAKRYGSTVTPAEIEDDIKSLLKK